MKKVSTTTPSAKPEETPVAEKKKKGFNLSRFLNSKRVLMVVSLLAAVTIWFVVANTVDNEITRTIINIPINTDDAVASLTNLGLRLTEIEDVMATVEVMGPRSLVGGLESDDFTVTGSLSGIAGAGDFSMKLAAAKLNNDGDYQIMSVSPATISISIDRQSTTTFPLEASIPNVTVPDGYMMEHYYLTPETVTVTASAENIAKIDHISIDLEIDAPFEESVTLEGALILYDDQGREIPQDNYIISPETATVTIPVYKLKTLELTASFVNIPPYFDVNTLKILKTTSTIDVAGPPDMIDTMSEIHFDDYIDMSTLSPGKTYTFPIVLPKDFINIKNINTTIWTFPMEGYSEKAFSFDNIVMINQPANYNIKVLTESLTDVRVIGPEEELATLTGEELAAELDFSKLELTEGQYSVTVSVRVPTRNSCWVVGQYSVVIVVKQK